MYETLLTNAECAQAIDMGDFYRASVDNRRLNYDKYFRHGDIRRNPVAKFNFNNTELSNAEQTKAKMLIC